MSERLRLLVIDDDLVDRLAIRRAVEQSGLDASIEEAATPTRRSRRSRRPRSTACSSTRICPDRRASSSRAQLRAARHAHADRVRHRTAERRAARSTAVDAGVTDFIPEERPVAAPARPADQVRDPHRQGRGGVGAVPSPRATRPRARATRSSRSSRTTCAARCTRSASRPRRCATRSRDRRRAISARSSAHRARAERLITRPPRGERDRERRAHADARADRRRRDPEAGRRRSRAARQRRPAARSSRTSPRSRSSCRPIAIACCRCSAT